MYWLSVFRVAVLAWASLCAIVLLGVGAHALSEISKLRNLPTFAWAGLSVATAVLAGLTLPAMLVVDFLRTGAFTSMIVVELSWFGFLGVLYLATGGAAADSAANFWVNCSAWFPASAQTVCNETSAAAAFGFLGWLGLWAYTITLLVILIIQANRGNYIWQRSVREALPASDSVAPVTNAAAEAKGYNNQHAYPPTLNAVSPQMTGYSQPMTAVSPQTTGYGQPQQPTLHAYPQV